MKCPNCGKEIPDDAQACVYCWEEVSQNYHPNEEPGKTLKEQKQNCRNEEICNCQPQTEEVGESSHPNAKKTNSIEVGVIGCIFFTAVLLGGAFSHEGFGPVGFILGAFIGLIIGLIFCRKRKS